MFAIVVFVGAEDEKLRAGSAREQRRLRATLADEPSSSYAYHDEVRVEQLRTPSVAKPANDTQPSPGKPHAGKATMIGRQIPAALSIEDMTPLVSPSIREAPAGNSARARPALSEPPDIGSWPPLPNVPHELEGAAEGGSRFRHDDLEDMPTAPPKRAPASRTPPSGAIWGAVPPMIGAGPADEDVMRPHSDEPPAAVEQPAARDRDLVPEPHASRTQNESYRDPELKRLEPLVERGAWENLAKELNAEPAHSAEYRLLRILAQRETLPSDDKAAGRLTQDAILALAELLGVPPSSATALMLAKRLLRRNPVWTQNQPATGMSIGVVIIGLLVGTGVGWLLTRFVM